MAGSSRAMAPVIEILGQPDALWSYTSPGCPAILVRPPVYSIDSKLVTLTAPLKVADTKAINDEINEQTYVGSVQGSPLELTLIVRISDSPVVRFKYGLKGSGHLTKTDGKDSIEFASFGIDPDDANAMEVRLFDYNSLIHGYIPTEVDIESYEFHNQGLAMGPVLAWSTPDMQVLAAYEHGSQWPDAYLSFSLHSDSVGIKGIKGSYDTNHDLSKPYESIWLELLAVRGSRNELRQTYRHFILHSLCPHPASRQPLVFYNTWNNQERTKSWHNSQFLTAMNETRILAEIDAASQMGIEVFVLDVGWFESTGDWRVSTARFPNGLEPVKAKLDKYGMQLGLWFGPTTASMSSKLLQGNVANKMSWRGEELQPREIWETELSAECCLVSGYADDFADVLIECARTYGVTYYKWDAVEQYGCDSPNHHHGNSDMSPQERADRYAFLQPIYMARIVERIQAQVPGAIVDFDITESARCVGLAFLAVGKYFLTNNGPYYFEYDIPNDSSQSYLADPLPVQVHVKEKRGTTYENINVFFHSGPARDWICRMGLEFDRWIPSTLFLVHYFPDDLPANNQLTSIASLALGHGGIWGDLVGVSDTGRKRFFDAFALLRKAREGATEVGLRRVGQVGGIVEAYDKIDPVTGEGLVVLFTGRRLERFWGGTNDTGVIPACARITSTAKRVSEQYKVISGEGAEVKVSHDKEGRAVVSLECTGITAAIVFFSRSL